MRARITESEIGGEIESDTNKETKREIDKKRGK